MFNDTSQKHLSPYMIINSNSTITTKLPPNIALRSTVTLDMNQWNQLAVTYSFAYNRFFLYHDGALAATGAGPSPDYIPPVTSARVYNMLKITTRASNGTSIVSNSSEVSVFEVFSSAH